MSHLDGLIVRGFRSFGTDEDGQAIKFSSPLTIIVGANGSGKTTIIECLKYATIGEMPPGSKGAMFVHDPKKKDKTEIKAQVKLKFFDVFHKPVVVTRSMVSQQKQRKVECRTLDAVIQRRGDNGKVTSVSLKCADIDHEMINLLGVSKAILDNVIFCHQEEFCWPLSDPKSLKTRFDDIFSATKYIKALDALKKVRLEQAQVIRQCTTEIKFLKQNKEKAEEIKQDMTKTEVKLKACNDSVNKIQERLKPLQELLQNIAEQNKKLAKLTNKRDTLTAEKTMLETQIVDLRKQIPEMYDGSDEQLEYDLANFAQEMSDKSRMLIANEQAVEALNQRISILTKTRNDKVSAKSRIEAEIEMIKKRISQRDELVGKLAGLMKISDEIAGDRSNVMPFMNAANDRLHDVKVELELIKTDFDRKLGDLDKQVSEATDKKAAAEQTARISDERRRKFEVEFKTMQHQLRDIDSSAPRIKELQKVIDQLNEEVVNLEQGFNETSVMAEIESSASTRKDVETKLNGLTTEMKEAQTYSTLRTELEMWRQNKKAKESNIQNIMARHASVIDSLLPDISPAASVHEFLRDKKSSITGFEAELEKLTAKLRNCDVERKMVMEQLSEREKELKDYEEKILSSSLQPELSVEENIQSVSQDMERLQLEKGTLDGASYMYRKYIDFLHKRPCCPLCNRDFANQVESQQLLKELETNLKSLPEEQKCLKVKLQKSQRKHQDLLQLQPTASLAKKLRNDVIPSLKSKSSALVNGIQEAKKAISEVETQLLLVHDDYDNVQKIETDAIVVDSVFHDVEQLIEKIQRHEDKLKQCSTDRPVSDIQADMEENQKYLASIVKSMEAKQLEIRNYHDRLQKLRNQLHTYACEKLSLVENMQQKSAMESKLEQLQKEVNHCKEETAEARQLLPSLEDKLKSLIHERRELQRQKDGELDERRKHVELLTTKINDIVALNKQIQLSDIEGQRNDLSRVVDKIDELCKTVEMAEKDKRTLFEKSEVVRSQISRFEVRRRELQDCTKFRSLEKSLAKVDVQLTAVVDEVKRYEKANAATSIDSANDEYQRLLNSYHEAMGRQSELQQYLKKCRRDLEGELYKNADEKYHNKIIEITTTQIACDDIQKYHSALDSAIIKYHSLKMQEVNRIVRELWQKVYRGTDIEYIEIKSEEEDGESKSDKRRAYNYRVTMHSDGADLDMRGRCSAGQKVLASVIIRIALAEVFCLNCGILTLDEPTTNLDTANIDGLARALVEIVESRSTQKNFQLIVITHDEAFVEQLVRDWPIEYYYRVKKDVMGLSRLYQERIEDLR